MGDGPSVAKGELKVSLAPPPPWCGQGSKPAGAAPAVADGPSSSASTSAVVALCFLAANCGAALYNSRHDPRSALFVAACFVNLALLFYFLRVFEGLPRGSPRRRQVKAAVWALTAALTLMFSQRVAASMPAPVAVVVWVMTAGTILAGFCMFFLCPDHEATVVDDYEKPVKLAAEGP